MPSFFKLSTFTLGFFHCFQMLPGTCRIHSSKTSGQPFDIGYHFETADPTIDKYLHFPRITLRHWCPRFRLCKKLRFFALARTFGAHGQRCCFPFLPDRIQELEILQKMLVTPLFSVHFQLQPAFQILPAGIPTDTSLRVCSWQTPQCHLHTEPVLPLCGHLPNQIH